MKLSRRRQFAAVRITSTLPARNMSGMLSTGLDELRFDVQVARDPISQLDLETRDLIGIVLTRINVGPPPS
jgi:hypothetical protein